MLNSDFTRAKAMHWPEIFVIPSFAKINLTGIPVSETDPKINKGFGFGNFRETYQKFSRNLSSKPLSKNNHYFCYYRN